MSIRGKHLRYLLLIPAITAFLCGVFSGLARLGVPVPFGIARLVGVHGALMIGGFFGTLIGLERAVAVGSPWAYLAPALSGLGAILLIVEPASIWASSLMAAGALAMFVVCVKVWLFQRAPHLATLAAAAFAWFLGALVWLWFGSIVSAVPLWAAFLVLTIAAERLELSRFVPTPPKARRAFGVITCTHLGAAVMSVASPVGIQIFALSLVALAAWLLRYDIARRTVRTQGLTRYMAVCLLSGYVWLGFAGLLGASGVFAVGNALRDAALHALLLGFVFSMVFGHAPIILPAITKLPMRWHAGFYVPLLGLHLTLLIRVWAGFSGLFDWRQIGALANAVVLLVFVAAVLSSLYRGGRSSTKEVRHGYGA